MLSRPTTAQILEDCRRELTETVAPAVGDEAVAVTVAMLDEVLGNCAVRAGSEIAWMRDESEQAVSFAREVAVAADGTGESTGSAEALSEALARHDADRTDSLLLDAVCADYSLAGQCLSEAIAVAADIGDDRLMARARELLDGRLAKEELIKGDWGFVGRG